MELNEDLEFLSMDWSGRWSPPDLVSVGDGEEGAEMRSWQPTPPCSSGK